MQNAVARRPVPALRIGAVLRLAAWLGVAGFGGGYVVVGQLHEITVRARRWLTDEQYLDMLAVAQGLPGAAGANFFTQLGLRAGGVPGAIAATGIFLLPSVLLMIAFGAAYGRLRDLAQVQAIFAGMNPAVVAVVATVALRLGKRVGRPWQLAVAAAALVAIDLRLLGVFELVTASIGVSLAVHWARGGAFARGGPPAAPPMAMVLLVPLVMLPPMAWVFLRLGASSFGGGLSLIPILDQQVVHQLGWLSPREFSDAVTLGQITPGPVAITTTFVGYRVAGLWGALIATVCTFLPPLVANLAVGRSVAAFRSSPAVSAVLSVLAPLVVGIIAAAALGLARSSIQGGGDWAVAFVSLIALVALDAPPLLVLAGAAAARALALLIPS